MKQRLFLVLIILLLGACGTNKAQREGQETMDAWEALVRWSQYDALVDFIHPEWLAEHPVTQLDIDRLHQFKVTEYRTRQVLQEEDGKSIERRAQIRLYHIHSARERVIDHRETWRYDEDLKVWLLHSGLPDPRRDHL
jgi:hypothetical protein